ncbi:hypothetical protein ACHQM5_027221 [Ranunculus cassubicifolius]
MHQPWASLLVHGIKRIEGRNWPTPLRGRIWIHAASKVPDPETIKAMEDFYRTIYAVDGITNLKFPEHYPVSRLVGSVEVVGCLKCEELLCWEAVPKRVRLEGLTKFCWLCEKPQRLSSPLAMRGNQGVYELEKKIYETAIRGLCNVEVPGPVSFPLPDPRDLLSLKPGSLLPNSNGSKSSDIENPPNLAAAIAGARAAATQFSRKETTHQTNLGQGKHAYESSSRQQLKDKFIENDSMTSTTLQWQTQERNQRHSHEEQNTSVNYRGNNYHQHNVPHQRYPYESSPRRQFTKTDNEANVALQWRPQQRDVRQNYEEQNARGRGNFYYRGPNQRVSASSNISTVNDRMSSMTLQQSIQERETPQSGKEKSICVDGDKNNNGSHQSPNPRLAPPSKIFQVALRGMRPN